MVPAELEKKKGRDEWTSHNAAWWLFPYPSVPKIRFKREKWKQSSFFWRGICSQISKLKKKKKKCWGLDLLCGIFSSPPSYWFGKADSRSLPSTTGGREGWLDKTGHIGESRCHAASLWPEVKCCGNECEFSSFMGTDSVKNCLAGRPIKWKFSQGAT